MCVCVCVCVCNIFILNRNKIRLTLRFSLFYRGSVPLFTGIIWFLDGMNLRRCHISQILSATVRVICEGTKNQLTDKITRQMHLY